MKKKVSQPIQNLTVKKVDDNSETKKKKPSFEKVGKKESAAVTSKKMAVSHTTSKVQSKQNVVIEKKTPFMHHMEKEMLMAHKNVSKLVEEEQKHENDGVPSESTSKDSTQNQITRTFKNKNYNPSDEVDYQGNDDTIEGTLDKLSLGSGTSHKYSDMQSPNSCGNYQFGGQNSEQFQSLMEAIKAKLIKIIPQKQLTNNGRVIGEGGYGSVYSGKWMNTDVAIKEMIMSYSEFKQMDQEMSFMAANRHPKLVNMFGISISEMRHNKLQCQIVMELMQQDLESYIFQNDPSIEISLKRKVNIMKDVIEGIYFLHSQEIVHRDIKPKNILLNNNFDAKLTDLGIAKALEDKEKTLNATIAFTARYVSKETAVEEVTSFASDIWSLGLVMYELFTENRCWKDLTSNKIIIHLAKEANPFEQGWENKVKNQQIVEIINSCVNYQPEKRPKATDLNNVFQVISKNIQ